MNHPKQRYVALVADNTSSSGYVAHRMGQVCKVLLDAGHLEQALRVSECIVEIAQAAPSRIAIAKSRAQCGDNAAATSVLHDASRALLRVLEQKATRGEQIPKQSTSLTVD
jgi:hypothetical protein